MQTMLFRRLVIPLLGLHLMILYLGTPLVAKTDRERPLAKVGSIVITTTQLNTRITQMPPDQQAFLATAKGQDTILNQLIDEALLVHQAKKQGLHRSEHYAKRLEIEKNRLLMQLILNERVITNQALSDTDIKTFYEQNNTIFNPLEQRRVSQIVVKTKAQAQAIRQQLQSGHAFHHLVSTYSMDTDSKKHNGDVGWLTQGYSHNHAIETAVFQLDTIGSLSDPVQSNHGYHILQLTGISLAPQQSLDQARPFIASELRLAKQEAALQAYLKTIRQAIPIKRF